MKKYIVIGGYVNSRTDGQRHYVNAMELCRLYKVHPSECLLVEERNPRDLITMQGMIKNLEQQGKDVFEYSVYGNKTQKIGNFTQGRLF